LLEVKTHCLEIERKHLIYYLALLPIIWNLVGFLKSSG